MLSRAINKEVVWSRHPAAFAGALVLLVAAFYSPLRLLIVRAAESDLNSYILLVPVIVAYLLYTDREGRSGQYQGSVAAAAVPFLGGCIGLICLTTDLRNQWLSENDYISVAIFSFVCFIWSGGFAFLGKQWMGAAAFPMVFLIFLVPLPDRAVEGLQNALQLASADAASLFFTMSGTPALRSGTVFQLPGIVLEVAQECSGIRSSWVLFITSLIAAHLFLRNRWSRTLLVAAVIPLGILRNGFRILVIGLLCIHIDPDMINSPIHRKGGPLFFAASLLPLALLLWFLRHRETIPSAVGLKRTSPSSAEPRTG